MNSLDGKREKKNYYRSGLFCEFRRARFKSLNFELPAGILCKIMLWLFENAVEWKTKLHYSDGFSIFIRFI